MTNQVVVTGHRLQRLGGYHLDMPLQAFATHLLGERTAVNVVHTGMALGFDQAIAFACVGLAVPFIAHVPFDGYENQWPTPARLKYRWLLSMADAVFTHSKGEYDPAMLHKRNRAMIDCAKEMGDTELWSLWDGSEQGGTYAARLYALHCKVPTWEVWEKWEAFYGA